MSDQYEDKRKKESEPEQNNRYVEDASNLQRIARANALREPLVAAQAAPGFVARTPSELKQQSQAVAAAASTFKSTPEEMDLWGARWTIFRDGPASIAHIVTEFGAHKVFAVHGSNVYPEASRAAMRLVEEHNQQLEERGEAFAVRHASMRLVKHARNVCRAVNRRFGNLPPSDMAIPVQDMMRAVEYLSALVGVKDTEDKDERIGIDNE